ncbi:MAG TPA: hypothetical protein VGG01_19160 [Xanthobacteraceae bacterium]|jgi:hypothetical protein
MTKKTIIALAISAIACTAWTSTAIAAKHKHKMAAPAAHAQAQTRGETIPGVNPMTNAPSTPAVEHPAAFEHMPGANPM